MKRAQIKQLMDVMYALREIHPEMNVNMILTLLEVAKGEGVTGRDIEVVLDMNHSTAARMLRYFDTVQANGKPGANLLETRLDPVDYRAKLRYLNKDGEDFMARLEEILSRK